MGTAERNRALRRKAIHDLTTRGTWTVQEIAAVLGVHPDTVYQALRRLQLATRTVDADADAAALRRDTAALDAALRPEI